MYAFTHIYMKFMRYSKYIIIIEKEQLTITHYTNPNFMWYYFTYNTHGLRTEYRDPK